MKPLLLWEESPIPESLKRLIEEINREGDLQDRHTEPHPDPRRRHNGRHGRPRRR